MSTLHHKTPKAPSLGLAAVIAAAILACLSLAPAPTHAGSATVVVTARVSPTFSLTLLSSGLVDFGTVAVGSAYTSAEPQWIVVRSSRPWEFYDSSDAALAVGDDSFPRETFLRHSVSVPFGSERPPGVHLISCDYFLDLTPVEAFDLPSDTALQTTFGYTAVQH